MEIVQSVILITAAGSPIGKAISLHFASLGAKLALVDIDKVQLNQTYRACKANGAACEASALPNKMKPISKVFLIQFINNWGLSMY
ncbi:SDR family NAD(P)-dependent oxidoreductase [Photobacterium swingsii]|uniref:SDR family NAD(P)-dependent oxidoreductase n=1 Tax=Photobacterium swingsii TaxID=680026 RepID=UPI000ADE8AF1|nr:SDR family NAD(P)-dependent oxidoreductase [Photobacterium swingsii]